MMAILAALVFWLALGLLVYAYAGYPALLWLAATMMQSARDWRYLRGSRDRRLQPARATPLISILIAAHDEAGRLAPQFASLARLTYPRWEAVYVTDGCRDGTAREIRAAGDARIRVLELPRRKGKANALNHAADAARGELLVFTDAGTRLEPDSLDKLARHFESPQNGVVCGRVEFDTTPGTARTEARYWQFECGLRMLESRLGITLTAHGGLYAMRRSAYRRLEECALVDDLLVPMAARGQGLKVLYDPEAVAHDAGPGNIAGQVRRRRRLAQGSFRALRQVRHTPLGIWTAWAFLSHKLLRWLTPFLLLALLLASFAGLPRQLSLAVWAAGLALVAVALVERRSLVYYALAMNLAYLQGWWRSLRPPRDGTWERVR